VICGGLPGLAVEAAIETEYDKDLSLTARMSVKSAETMFEPEDEVLKLEQFVSGCTAAETEVAMEKFEFEINAVVMHTNWLTYDRLSDVTISTCEADGGTISNTL
jgi:hypothetical protein